MFSQLIPDICRNADENQSDIASIKLNIGAYAHFWCVLSAISQLIRRNSPCGTGHSVGICRYHRRRKASGRQADVGKPPPRADSPCRRRRERSPFRHGNVQTRACARPSVNEPTGCSHPRQKKEPFWCINSIMVHFRV